MFIAVWVVPAPKPSADKLNDTHGKTGRPGVHGITKSWTNLDSILKNSDITLPTEVHIVKAMVFQVVMYGCESWTFKKAEH